MRNNSIYRISFYPPYMLSRRSSFFVARIDLWKHFRTRRKEIIGTATNGKLQ